MALSGIGWEIVPVHLAVGPVGGLSARDQRASAWQQSVKRHDVITGRRKLPVNVRASRINVSGGRCEGATCEYDTINAPTIGVSKNARRKAARYGK